MTGEDKMWGKGKSDLLESYFDEDANNIEKGIINEYRMSKEITEDLKKFPYGKSWKIFVYEDGTFYSTNGENEFPTIPILVLGSEFNIIDGFFKNYEEMQQNISFLLKQKFQKKGDTVNIETFNWLKQEKYELINIAGTLTLLSSHSSVDIPLLSREENMKEHKNLLKERIFVLLRTDIYDLKELNEIKKLSYLYKISEGYIKDFWNYQKIIHWSGNYSNISIPNQFLGINLKKGDEK